MCGASPLRNEFAPAELQQQGADVGQQFAQTLGEASGSGAVDHTVIVGQRQRQHQLGLEGFAIPYRLDGCLGHTKDRHFRGVDDRREASAANVTQAGDGEAAALHVVGSELLGACFFCDFRSFGSQLQQALLVDILDHRNYQTFRGIHGEADVYVFLADDRFAAWRQGAVEIRQLLEQMRACLEQQWQHGQLDASLFCNGFLGNTESFQLGDVSLIELSHVRDVQPAAVQASRAQLHQASHRHFFDFAEAAEVDRRDWLDTSAARCAAGRCFFGLEQLRLDVSLHVFFEHTAVWAGCADCAQLNAELASQLTNSRACVNLGAVFGWGGWSGS